VRHLPHALLQHFAQEEDKTGEAAAREPGSTLGILRKTARRQARSAFVSPFIVSP
jgi:hypothetical protein